MSKVKAAAGLERRTGREKGKKGGGGGGKGGGEPASFLETLDFFFRFRFQ